MRTELIIDIGNGNNKKVDISQIEYLELKRKSGYFGTYIFAWFSKTLYFSKFSATNGGWVYAKYNNPKLIAKIKQILKEKGEVIEHVHPNAFYVDTGKRIYVKDFYHKFTQQKKEAGKK